MNSIKDLMSFLKDEYVAYLEASGDGEDDTAVVDEDDNILLLDSFVNWATLYLAKTNPPMNITYLPTGLGLRLLLGQTVAFQEQQLMQDMRDTGIPISKPKEVGMYGMFPDNSIHI